MTNSINSNFSVLSENSYSELICISSTSSARILYPHSLYFLRFSFRNLRAQSNKNEVQFGELARIFKIGNAVVERKSNKINTDTLLFWSMILTGVSKFPEDLGTTVEETTVVLGEMGPSAALFLASGNTSFSVR